VGSTAFGNFSSKDNRIEIGWSWMETLSQGTGINKNAKFHLLDFAFDYLNIERLFMNFLDILSNFASGVNFLLPIFIHGLASCPTLISGSRLCLIPSTTTTIFWRSKSWGWVSMPNSLVILNSWAERLPADGYHHKTILSIDYVVEWLDYNYVFVQFTFPQHF